MASDPKSTLCVCFCMRLSLTVFMALCALLAVYNASPWTLPDSCNRWRETMQPG